MNYNQGNKTLKSKISNQKTLVTLLFLLNEITIENITCGVRQNSFAFFKVFFRKHQVKNAICGLFLE